MRTLNKILSVSLIFDLPHFLITLYIKVACGTAVSYAVTGDGKLYRCFSAQSTHSHGADNSLAIFVQPLSLNSWGMGTNGQLGTGEEEDVWEPYLITSKQIKDR